MQITVALRGSESESKEKKKTERISPQSTQRTPRGEEEKGDSTQRHQGTKVR